MKRSSLHFPDLEPSRRMVITPPRPGGSTMARKYSRKASAKVGRAMRKRKAGTLKSGASSRKVRSPKQAIAIGLSEARREGDKVPPRKSSKRKSSKRKSSKKRKSAEKRTPTS